MKCALRLAVLALAVTQSARANRSQTVALNLSATITSTKYCEFSPVAQGLIVSVRLRFVNIGHTDFLVQDVGGPDEVPVAKSRVDIAKGIYEFTWHPGERLEPTPSSEERKPLLIKPHGSFETTHRIYFMVGQQAIKASDQWIDIGTHYLKIRNDITVGESDPITWRAAPVWSQPVPLNVKHVSDVSRCQRRDPSEREH